MSGMEKEINAGEVIDVLGGTCFVAKMFDIKPPSVSEWRKANKIPKARLQYLKLARPDLFPSHGIAQASA